MAVYEITEQWSGGKGAGEESPDGRNYNADGTRVFDVLVDDPVNDSEATVLSDDDLPQIGDYHPDFENLTCRHRIADTKNPMHYVVTCTYQANAELGQSPLDLPPIIRWTKEITEEEVDTDVLGKVMCTVLGESYDPPFRRRMPTKVLHVTRNMADYDPTLDVDMTTNSQPLVVGNYVMPIGTMLLLTYTGEEIYDPSLTYWKVEAEWHCRRGRLVSDAQAWWRRVRAEGFKVRPKIKGATSIKQQNPVEAMDMHGRMSSKPVLHDTTTGYPIYDPSMAQWYLWQDFLTYDHNLLGLLY